MHPPPPNDRYKTKRTARGDCRPESVTCPSFALMAAADVYMGDIAVPIYRGRRVNGGLCAACSGLTRPRAITDHVSDGAYVWGQVGVNAV